MLLFDDFFRTLVTTGGGEATLCGADHKKVADVVVKNPMQLLPMEAGDGTVFLDGGTYLCFPQWHEHVMNTIGLFESPDFFANKYRRSGERAVLFIGDRTASGVIWAWNRDGVVTHSDLVRKVKKGDLTGVNIVGNPNLDALEISRTGAILPKTDDVDSPDATYVSMWVKDEYRELTRYINAILRQIGAEAPYVFDRPLGEYTGPWDIVEWLLEEHPVS